MDGKGPQDAAAATELTQFVQGLLSQMRGRFDKMSDSIISKVDDMGAKIDSLEKDIAELVEQGAAQPGATAPSGANASAGGARS